MTGKRVTCGLLLAVIAAVAGCSSGGGGSDDDNNNNNGGSTKYTGTFSDANGGAGVLTFSIPKDASASLVGEMLAGSQTTITGTLTVAGSPTPIDLTGDYDPQSGDLTLTGGGYTLVGDRNSDGTFQGTVTGPGIVTGVWVALVGGSSDILVLCGTFTCSDPPECASSGTFNLAVSDPDAFVVVNFEGLVAAIGGTVDGSNVHFATFGVTVDGEISGSSATGTWSNANSAESGDWSGSSEACQGT